MTSETTVVETGTTELLCVIRDRVAIIKLNRPEVRNAMSDKLTPALRNMIRPAARIRSRRAFDYRRRHGVLRRRQRQGHGLASRSEETGDVL